MAQLAGTNTCNLQDLGSSPRSVQIPYYFSSINPMQLQRDGLPYSIQIRPYIHPRTPDLKAKIQGTQYALVNAPYGNWQSQWIQCLMGLTC